MILTSILVWIVIWFIAGFFGLLYKYERDNRIELERDCNDFKLENIRLIEKIETLKEIDNLMKGNR